MIVILDCNIWLSLALNQQLSFISQLNKYNISIATCNELIDEVTQVSSRPKFRKYFSPAYIKQLVDFHQLISRRFPLKAIPNIVTDEKDNYLFALCEASNADYFVTGDKLLLNVGIYKTTKVITLTELRNMLK